MPHEWQYHVGAPGASGRAAVRIGKVAAAGAFLEPDFGWAGGCWMAAVRRAASSTLAASASANTAA